MMLKRLSALLLVVLLSFEGSAQAEWATIDGTYHVPGTQNEDSSASLFPDPSATDESDDLSDFMSLFSADLTTPGQDDQSESSYVGTLFPGDVPDPDPVANLDVQSSGDFQYVVLDDGTAQITGYTGSDAQLVLPQTLDGYTVTSIGEEAFARTKASDIVCPESLRMIEAKAFRNSDHLSRIELNEGLLSIGEDAFRSCRYLASVVLPDSLVSLGEDAFKGCESLTSVVLSAGLKQIEEGTFEQCTMLRDVKLPEGLVSIGDKAFFNCESLSNIQFPASLTSIGKDAFAFTAYEHVTAPAGMANTQQEPSAELCSYCVGGWVECSTCGTFGCCPSCEGLGGPMVYTANGWERDECDACGDSGACPTCGYSGFLECKFCNGSGFAY